MALPISYHWRNLFIRKTTTVLTVLVITAVVGVFAWLISFALAMQASMSVAADERNIIVLKRGATAESNSAIPPEEAAKLTQVADVASDPKTGEPLASREMLVQVQLPRLRDGGRTFGNVAIRGVTELAFDVHPNVKITTGRRWEPGAAEILVGRQVTTQFGGQSQGDQKATLEIGNKIKLGSANNREFTIVGYFVADGGPIESEIWAYQPLLSNVYNRSMYSAVTVRLRESANAKAAVEQIEGPSIQLLGMTEKAYWDDQFRTIRTYLWAAGMLIVVMSLAAVFAIANTMFSAVAGRTREIAMLRTIGYSGGSILSGFVIESVLLCLLGGALGCAACAGWLSLVGNKKDMFGASTFTTMGFEIHLSIWTVALSLAMVTIVGVIGAVFPAARAARLQVISALREP